MPFFCEPGWTLTLYLKLCIDVYGAQYAMANTSRSSPRGHPVSESSSVRLSCKCFGECV